MKKTLLTILATVCVMAVGFGAYIAGMKANYENKLAETKHTYEEQITAIYKDKLELMYDYDDLNSQMDELEEQVYKIMNDQSYDVTINKDGEFHTYKAEKEDNGIFSEITHIIGKFE